MRLTHATVQVAAVLVEKPRERHWGYQTGKAAGVRSGVLYPILARMLADGWLSDGWEEGATGRPPRRYYEITELGLIRLGALLADAAKDPRFARLDLKPRLA